MIFDDFNKGTIYLLQIANPRLFAGPDIHIYTTNCELCNYVGRSTEVVTWDGYRSLDNFKERTGIDVIEILFIFEIGCCVSCCSSLQIIPLTTAIKKMYELYTTFDNKKKSWGALGSKYYREQVNHKYTGEEIK